MWWWIEPLWYTGLILFFISLFWICTFKNSEKFWPAAVTLILWLPLIVAGASEIVWILIQFFRHIWGHYI